MAGPNRETAFIALGSNVGNRQATINAAIAMLSKDSAVQILKVSDLIETAAVGMGQANAFLNGAAEISTTRDPGSLLKTLLDVEKTLGRVRSDRWQPRTIDLDLLLYGQQVLSTPGLALPHPLMHKRTFVLGPLLQIAPDAIHPLLKRTVRQLHADLVEGSRGV